MTSESFILKRKINKAVKVSPQKNAWGDTSSPWYRNTSETACRLPKENTANFLRRLNRKSECTQLYLMPVSSCENVIKNGKR